MAIIRHLAETDSAINYVATLAFFCCVSCVALMLKFRGFRASLNFSSLNKEEELAPAVSITGSYRVNRDEFYGNGSLSEPPKKLTPSMVKLPHSAASHQPALRPTKSTSDLVAQPTPQPLSPQQTQHQSALNVSSDPRGGPSTSQVHRKPAPAPPPPERKKRDAKNQLKEQKKLEKQRLAEQKAREKAAAQEQAKQEKLRREREKKEAKEQAKIMKMNKKKQAPKPQVANPLASNASQPNPQMSNLLAANAAPIPPPPPQATYSTNTLESSISKSSGPPPYAEMASNDLSNVQNSNPSDVSFGKPIDKPADSWDMISQHRQQLNRPISGEMPRNRQKNLVMDLNYKLGSGDNNVNSDA